MGSKGILDAHLFVHPIDYVPGSPRERSIRVRMVPWKPEIFVELTYIASNTAVPSGISRVTNQHSRREKTRTNGLP